MESGRVRRSLRQTVRSVWNVPVTAADAQVGRSKTCLCYVMKQPYYSVHIYMYVYSGDLCDYEIYLSLSVYCSDLTYWGVQISVRKIGER